MFQDDDHADERPMLDQRHHSARGPPQEGQGQRQRQSQLPFKHRKETSSSSSAGLVPTLKSAKTSAAAPIVARKENGSFLKVSDAAEPDIVVLSDSEGASPIFRPTSLSQCQRTAVPASAAQLVPASKRPSLERDVVILGSDSDEDICSDSLFGVRGQLNMSRDSTQKHDSISEKQESVADGGRVGSTYRGDETRPSSSPARDQLPSAALNSTDEGYDSDPEWLREPWAPAEALDRACERKHDYVDNGGIQMGLTQDRPHIEFLEDDRIHSPVLHSDLEHWEESSPEDRGKGKRRRNGTTTEGKGALDERTNLEGTAEPENKRKQNPTMRRKPLSVEELAAREEKKQRERDAKKARQKEEKRAREEKRDELKRQKQAAKEQDALHKKAEREREKRAKGINAEKNTRVYLDSRVAEMGSLASVLFQQLAAKGCRYKVRKQPVDGTILWRMVFASIESRPSPDDLGSQPDQLMESQVVSESQAKNVEKVDIHYVAVVLSGEEFAKKVSEDTLSTHVAEIQTLYPSYRICYIIMGLMKYLKAIEQKKYREGDLTWRRPPVEQALAEFVTCYAGVCYRLCIDGTEVADHIIGLTAGHAKVPFRPKLSSVSIQANGNHVTKCDPNKNVIKKNTWLKMLVAIPNIPGATAIAIAKLYPSMRALLNVYLDPVITDNEKELLLQSIVKDIPLGSYSLEGRRVGPVASRRIYRVLTAQNGSLSTDDAEDGADYFAPET